jgi:hypothetical protein
VNTSGWLFSRVSQQFSGTLTVTNTSSSPINGLILVVLNNLSTGVTLVNGNGTSSGAPLVTVQSSGILAPAGSATVTLQFMDPSKGPITFSPAVYSN